MNTMEQDPSGAPAEENRSRREFFQDVGKGLAAIKLFEWGLLHGESEAGKKEKPNKVFQEIQGLVNEYGDQKTNLSETEVTNILEKTGFVEDVNIQRLNIKDPWKPFTKRDVLRESLDEALQQKNLLLDSTNLNVVQTEFNKIGAFSQGAFYSKEFRTIFINQRDEKGKRDDMENLIYREATSLEYRAMNNVLDDAKLSDIEKDQKRKSLTEWLRSCLEQPKPMGEISQLISKYPEPLKKSIREFRTQKAIDRVITETNLPHEAFHHFYENMLGKEGYEGPDMGQLLAAAIRGRNTRFGGKDPSYGNIGYWLQGIDTKNDQDVNDFAAKIASQYDLTVKPREYSDEEWSRLDDRSKDAYLLPKEFNEFLNEYWARVYNSQSGNTSIAVKLQLEKAAIEQKGTLPQYNLEDMYHEPTPEETVLLRQMKWRGKSIIQTK